MIIYITPDEKGIPEVSYPGYLRSKYILTETEIRLPYGFLKRQYRIEEITSGKLLATATNLSFRGGWIKESLGKIGGPSIKCPRDILSPRKYLNDVLKPVIETKQGE